MNENEIPQEDVKPSEISTNEIAEDKQPEKKENLFFTNRFVFIFLFVFGIAFTLSTYIFQVVFTSVRVVGESMKPTINANFVDGKSNADKGEDCDIVFCYKLDGYQTNDIVVINNPLQNGKYRYVPFIITQMEAPITSIIKRVIACPGETITFHCTVSEDNEREDFIYNFRLYDRDGNEKAIDQSYLTELMLFYYPLDPKNDSNYRFNETYFPKYIEFINALKSGENHEYSITIPENQYFVMGDNRNKSTDSRYFGLIDQNDITGKVVLHVKYGKTVWNAIWDALTSYKILPERKIYEI